MNLFLTTRRAVFLPWGTILKHLENYWTSQQKRAGLARPRTLQVYALGARPIGEKSNSNPEVLADLLNQEIENTVERARRARGYETESSKRIVR
jgi:hypothetical protein